MNMNCSLYIGPIKFEARRKQWEGLYEKYEKRGRINTAECYFSDVSCKMFLPSVKSKFKAKACKVKKRSSNLNRETVDHTVNPGEYSDTDSTVSSTREIINVNAYETDSGDSGVEMGDKVEEIGETLENNSSSMQFMNVNASQIIDEDDGTFAEMCSLNDQREIDSTLKDHLQQLVVFIEVNLKSELKVILRNRSVSKLLESDDYGYWHDFTKQEMRRLEKYISRNELKEYMRYCDSADIPEHINVRSIKEILVNKMQSNIKNLFFKREFMKEDKNKYTKYRRRVFIEWQRLAEVVPVEYLLLYGTSVLFAIEKLKEEKSLSKQNES